MRLITMYKSMGEAKLEFYGCPLTCRSCGHRARERRDVPLDQVKKFLRDYETRRIFIGGAEPTLQKHELLDLLKWLRIKGKEVTLKTAGTDPEFLGGTIGLVHRYLVEVRTPFDDAEAVRRLTGLDQEGAASHLKDVRRSLDVLRGQKVRVLVRVIPTILDRAKIGRLGQQLEGYAEEVQMVQFMSGTSDIPFEGVDRPAPAIEEMEEMAQIMLNHVPLIILQGDGLDTTLRR
jgi:pyruvate formate lyase activating enzyme